LPAGMYNSMIGYGRRVEIDQLETGATSGCQLCTLLVDVVQVWDSLSQVWGDLLPRFVGGYHDAYLRRVPRHLFLQCSDTGTLLAAIDHDGTYLDHLEIYTQRGEP
jgi:hypothetical protein